MIPPSPIDSNIRNASEHDISSIDATPGSKLTEMIQALKARTIERLVDLKQCFQLRIIPNLPLLIIFISTNDLIFFPSDPILQIVNVGGMVK